MIINNDLTRNLEENFSLFKDIISINPVLSNYYPDLDERSIIADNYDLRHLMSRECNYKFTILDKINPPRYSEKLF